MTLRMRPVLPLLAAALALAAVASPSRLHAKDTTLDFLLVMDESGSMEVAPPYADKRRLRVDAARLFVELVSPEDRVGVIGFGERVTDHTGGRMIPASKEYRTYLHKAIGGVGGNQRHTDIYGALSRATVVLTNRGENPDKTFIILLSDGRVSTDRDIPPDYLMSDSIADYREKIIRSARDLKFLGFPVLAIGLGPEVDVVLMREIAELSGGRFYRAETATQLQAIYSDIFVTLADRYSNRQTGAHSPLEVSIEPGLQEFIALAFPREEAPVTPGGRPGAGGNRFFRAGFSFVGPDGKTRAPDNHASTRSWNLVRLTKPEPGVWKVVFDPSLSVDVLMVKHSGCEIDVTSPAQGGEYPPGKVPVRISAKGPDGAPSKDCAGSVDARIAGAGGSQVVTVSAKGTGAFEGETAALTSEGEYTLQLAIHPPGSSDFSNLREVTFSIKKGQPRPLDVSIIRPDAATYPDGTEVPIRIQVKPRDGQPIAKGEATLEAKLSGPSGSLTLPLTEEGGGIFTGKTDKLRDGAYTITGDARLAVDPKSTGRDSAKFTVQTPPPVQLEVTVVKPDIPRYFTGAIPLEVLAKRAGAGGLTGAEAQVTADLVGPGAPKKYELTGGEGGKFAGTTDVLKQAGAYEVSFRCQLKDDAKTVAQASVKFEVVMPTVAVSPPKLVPVGDGATIPLFLGEGFDVSFGIQAQGLEGEAAPEVWLDHPVAPGEPPKQSALTPEKNADGTYKVSVPSTESMGAYLVRIRVAGTGTGGVPVESTTAMPVPVLLGAFPHPHSIPGGELTTYTLPLVSMFESPVAVVGSVDAIDLEQGSTSAPPLLTPAESVQLTKAETTEQWDPFEFAVDPAPAGSYGPYKFTVTLRMAGRYDDGSEWQRDKNVDGLGFTLESPPMSPMLWLILLAMIGAALMAKPNFRGCFLRPDGERPLSISHYAGATESEISVGGPGQKVVLSQGDVTPVILRAKWFFQYEVVKDGRVNAMKSGDVFEVGGVSVKFFKGSEPQEPQKQEPAGAPPPPPPADLDTMV